MPYLASVEVDQRQSLIQEADTLREMLGASRIIEFTVKIAEEELKHYAGVRLFWPVSGVLKFYAEKLDNLANFITHYQHCLESVSLTASIGLIESTSNLDHDLRNLERRVRKRKDSRTAALTLPSVPFLAPCSILPHLPANSWNMRTQQQERRLRSWQAEEREEYRNKNRNQPIFGVRIPWNDLPELEDLAKQNPDSYIGILKGDLDGLGKLLAKLSFSKLAQLPAIKGPLRQDLPASLAAADAFCRALQGAVEKTIQQAYDDLYPEPTRKRGVTWPFRHLIVAGDDVLILAQRQVALQLVFQVGERLARNFADDPVLTGALESAGIEDHPTISFGLLFTKTGYPADASFDLADELLKSAKQKGADSSRDQVGGFVDFHWLADSGRTRLKSIRQEHYFYRDDSGEAMQLTTRPWGMSVLDHFIDAARKLQVVPRRKLKQLDEIARLGKDLSELAFLGWWQRLRETEQETVKGALAKISWNHHRPDGIPSLWGEIPPERDGGYETCFLDLVELTEVME